jgi:cell division protease FtsH
MNEKLKRSTAYHEAGHYIVTKFSEELVEYELLAVSIYPAEDYLGVNVFDIDSDATSSGSLDYHIQRIASLLAGRIAEENYSKTFTSGAASDLVKATTIASNVVTQYALDGKASKYRVYNSSKEKMPTFSDQTVSSIDDRINAILDMAEEYAKKLLDEKKVYLEMLVDALVEKGMLTEPEIKKLFATIKSRSRAKRVKVTY